MGGFVDQAAIIGDWMASSPGPKGFYSSLINDDVVSWSIGDSNSENKPRPHFLGPGAGNADHKDQNLGSNFNTLAESKSGYRGDLLDRRAGFNAQKLNTEIIRPTEFRKEQEVRPPLFAFPPGLISPTSLLDSPVFLSNSLVLPSPTTGKFSFAPSVNNRNSTLMVNDSDHGKGNSFEDANASSFAFKPIQDSTSFPYFIAVNKVNDDGPFQPENVSESHGELNRGSNLTSEHSLPLHEMHEDDGDPETGEDGYNWRKYGQKRVKGSKYPRYYKCMHPNCQVKKKVERSCEGHITEIIYKGTHEHPKPPLNRRSAFDSSNSPSESQLDSEQSNGDRAWSTVFEGNTVGPADWSQENLEATSVGQEYVNGNGVKYEPLDGVDGSSTLSNNENGDDRSTQGSESLDCDGEGEEPESKKRRIEIYASDVSEATKAIRETRVVVQTTSEVDILDDGYRWRKYGQKIVKGNPNPRSYYKCTSPGCNVRKHVERASHDLKSVITTYEGKHNHDVPAARNSSHNNSLLSTTISTQQTPAGSNHIQRPEPSQIHMTWFERPSLGSYGFPDRPPLGPGPGFGYGVNQPGLASVDMSGLESSVPVNPYLQHQTCPMNGMAFMVPLGEPRLEPVMHSGLNHSSVLSYQQFMNQLPLGPQM